MDHPWLLSLPNLMVRSVYCLSYFEYIELPVRLFPLQSGHDPPVSPSTALEVYWLLNLPQLLMRLIPTVSSHMLTFRFTLGHLEALQLRVPLALLLSVPSVAEQPGLSQVSLLEPMVYLSLHSTEWMMRLSQLY